MFWFSSCWALLTAGAKALFPVLHTRLNPWQMFSHEHDCICIAAKDLAPKQKRPVSIHPEAITFEKCFLQNFDQKVLYYTINPLQYIFYITTVTTCNMLFKFKN